MNDPLPSHDIRNAYTDAPELYPNYFLGSLQLLVWLFFHPSAWHNYILNMDLNLRPDFCLAELSREQWHNPLLQRVLRMVYLCLPLYGILLSGLVLGVLGQTIEDIVVSVAFGLAFGLAGGVVLTVAVSMTVGMVALTVGVITFSLAIGIAGGTVAILAFIVAFGSKVGVTFDSTTYGMVAGEETVGLAVSLAFGATFSLASSAALNKIKERLPYSITKQLGGIILGVLAGVLAISAVIVLANNIIIGVSGVFAISMVFAIVDILALGWRTHKWTRALIISGIGSIVFGTAFGIAVNMTTNGVALGMMSGIAYGVMVSGMYVPHYLLVERVGGTWAGAIAATLGSIGVFVLWWIAVSSSFPWLILLLCLSCIVLGLTQTWWRPVVFYPLMAVWNLLLYRADERRNGHTSFLLRWHSVFWDEHQRLRLFGLDEHLTLIMSQNPVEGKAAMEYIVTTHQRWAAMAAQIELDARNLETCKDVAEIRQVHYGLAAGELAGPSSALLRSFSRISQDVEAALHQESRYNQRLSLSAVEDRLDSLLRELTRSSEHYAIRFRPIADHWRQIVSAHVHKLVDQVEVRQEIRNPYVIGVPLTAQQEVFVGRADVSARMEELLREQIGAPLFLYGQRRTGKTSLLNNLGRLLPSTIVPLFVDLQGPASRASDHTGFLYNIARNMISSAQKQRGLFLPTLTREALTVDPFTCFDEWLDEVELHLGQNAALLALDEFEALEYAFSRGHFDEQAVLGMLRYLIQHRPRFKVLLAGSHTLDEFERWASYLINVQVVDISYLCEEEANQLIERPIKDFALHYDPEAAQRVMKLTHCHPFLLQLLCSEIVALKNEQEPSQRRRTSLTDVETAVPEALKRGRFFFADIEQNQVDSNGLILLQYLAAQGEDASVTQETLTHNFPNRLDTILNSLLRREILEKKDESYRFQIELIRRWFDR